MSLQLLEACAWIRSGETPEQYRKVLAAGAAGGEVAPIGAECQREDRRSVAAQNDRVGGGVGGAQIPQPRGAVGAAGSEVAPIGAKRDRHDLILVAAQHGWACRWVSGP